MTCGRPVDDHGTPGPANHGHVVSHWTRDRVAAPVSCPAPYPAATVYPSTTNFWTARLQTSQRTRPAAPRSRATSCANDCRCAAAAAIHSPRATSRAIALGDPMTLHLLSAIPPQKTLATVFPMLTPAVPRFSQQHQCAPLANVPVAAKSTQSYPTTPATNRRSHHATDALTSASPKVAAQKLPALAAAALRVRWTFCGTPPGAPRRRP